MSDLKTKISAILFESDPVGLNYNSNTDEYDGEATRLVDHLRFSGVGGVLELERTIRGIFDENFKPVPPMQVEIINRYSSFRVLVGNKKCLEIAYKIWKLIHKECL